MSLPKIFVLVSSHLCHPLGLQLPLPTPPSKDHKAQPGRDFCYSPNTACSSTTLDLSLVDPIARYLSLFTSSKKILLISQGSTLQGGHSFCL